MANKSFVIQYLIKARDRYSAAANKAAKATEHLRRKVKKLKKSFGELSAKTRRAGAIMTAAVTVPIALMANHLKNAARDAAETESKFATVFKSIGGKADKVAADLAKNYGLASDQSKQLLSDTGDLLTGFGFSQESALGLSEQVNKLAVDLASFTNFSGGAEGASAALTKALLGERESLKTLGIAILEKDVKQKVSQMLAEGQTFASLRQAKAQATLAIAIEQSKNAIGDFARTQEELANQERITSARTRDLMVSFGKILLPIALKITKAIRGVVDTLLSLSPSAKKTILVIAGLVAVVGPLLLALGSIVLIWPAIVTGFTLFAGATAIALGPVTLLALAALLIIDNWGTVVTFFKSFASGISDAVGPSLSGLIGKFIESSKIIAELFSSNSEAAEGFIGFANVIQAAGQLIGDTLDIIIRAMSGIGEIIGQTLGAVFSLDFGNFDLGAIKDAFVGGEAKKAKTNAVKVIKQDVAAKAASNIASTQQDTAIIQQSLVEVAVNVGLDKGLKQTTPTAVVGQNVRRTDVGLASG